VNSSPVITLAVLLTLILAGCSRAQPATSAPVEPVASATPVAPPAAAPSGEVTSRPVNRQPLAVVNAPFAAPDGHSPLAKAAQRAGLPADGELDAFTLHAYRSQDAGAPAVEAVGSTMQAARPLTLAPELLTVRTAPGALVAFHAAALGTFATGCNGIAVVAGPDGLARVAFRTGQDGGDYQVMAVSPARSGVALFQINVE
jgi:hypothetical protein